MSLATIQLADAPEALHCAEGMLYNAANSLADAGPEVSELAIATLRTCAASAQELAAIVRGVREQL